MKKPLCIDLYCGLGGWSEAFLAEGWDCIGFDIERHDYGSGGYPGQLVLQDVCTLHGAQFVDADCLVASSPCQEFSYRSQPWKVAKAQSFKDLGLTKPSWWEKSQSKMNQAERSEWECWKKSYPVSPPVLGINLFWQAFRIQYEAHLATGYECVTCGGEERTIESKPAGYGYSDDLAEHVPCPECSFKSKKFIPLVAENVRGAQPWVGRAVFNYKSFYLWGDVPALMPRPMNAFKVPDFCFDGSGKSFQAVSVDGLKWGDCAGKRFDERPKGSVAAHREGTKNGKDWFGSGENCSLQRRASSGSNARKAASAQIAKIPPPLAQHIAQVYRP